MVNSANYSYLPLPSLPSRRVKSFASCILQIVIGPKQTCGMSSARQGAVTFVLWKERRGYTHLSLAVRFLPSFASTYPCRPRPANRPLFNRVSPPGQVQEGGDVQRKHCRRIWWRLCSPGQRDRPKVSPSFRNGQVCSYLLNSECSHLRAQLRDNLRMIFKEETSSNTLRPARTHHKIKS